MLNGRIGDQGALALGYVGEMRFLRTCRSKRRTMSTREEEEVEGDFETLINFLSFHHASDLAVAWLFASSFLFPFPLFFPSATLSSACGRSRFQRSGFEDTTSHPGFIQRLISCAILLCLPTIAPKRLKRSPSC